MPELPKTPEGLLALELVWAERLRQKAVEDYTPAHDDEHTDGQLALLAAAYAMSSRTVIGGGLYDDLVRAVQGVGWDIKPADPIRDLVRAGALILAELERRLRAEEKEEGCGPCSVCQAETTYTGEHLGAKNGVWLCPDHGGKP